MTQVQRKDNESTENLIRRFNRKVIQSGVLSAARKNRFHQKDPNRRARRTEALRQEKRRQVRAKKMGWFS
ncbi:30S ribosomal protein S21 [Patescibacteria group bacterium]|nr:30S ribosomal protein S21 [Patescibacteria group bacterium]